jgi:hypothetical protein
MAGFTCLLSPVPAFAQPDLKKLEGEYERDFKVSFYAEHDREDAGDSLEIFPVSPSSAYFHTLLMADNGSQCETSGIAKAEGDDLVYREQVTGGSKACTLRLHITRNRITFVDKGLTCQSACGAHGAFDRSWFPRKSRKPIADPETFKSSDDFTRALEESGQAHGKQKP